MYMPFLFVLFPFVNNVHCNFHLALQLGLALPKWLVDESNSFWVLGLYTVVFMVGLPTLVVGSRRWMGLKVSGN